MSALHLSDRDFKERVLESKLPVMVDFWAEWCVEPNTLISKDLRKTVSAKNLKEGNQLISYKDGIADDLVTYSKTATNAGHCRQIITERGRKIKVTDDHPFYTKEDWQEARDLKKGENVAVMFGLEKISARKRKRILIDEGDIYKRADERMQVGEYIKQLKDRKLLPLRENNELLLVLARLMGFLFTDGSLYKQKSNNYREVSFCLGDRRDIKGVVKDLSLLGFKGHISKRESSHEIEERKFTMRTKRVKCLSTAFWLLLKALGVPEGNKTNQVYYLPSWLLNTTKDIKREFLAGFLGGDGPKLLMHESFRKKKGSHNTLTINDLEFYKRVDLEKEGVEFGKQLQKLFKEFDVEITKIFAKPASYVRKDGTKTTSIHLKFKQDFATGLNLVYRIGYAYSWQKWWASSKVGEFLRFVMEQREKWQKTYLKVKKLSKAGLSPVIIAKKLDLSIGAVWGWLRLGRKPSIQKHFKKFPSWIKEMTEDLEEGFLWDQVLEVKRVYLPIVQRISVNKSQNFIANEFLVHNCPPCRLAGPVIDELAKEYEGKMVVAKVDVGKNQALASKFSVMSIPTVIFFKNGKEVERVIGFPGKEGYEEKIKDFVRG